MSKKRTYQNTFDIEAITNEIQNTSASPAWQSYSCTLITPMYGGGVHAGEFDKSMPIRPSAIRGHLRFWWRIARGTQFESPKALFKHEAEIWGGVGSERAIASQVAIKVQEIKPEKSPPQKDKKTNSQTPTPVDPNTYTKPSDAHGIRYAFGPATINSENDWLQEGYSFTIKLRYPDSLEEDVITALRFWASFGGIGARTRRGFGAIQVTGNGVAPVSPEEWQALGGQIKLVNAKKKSKAFSQALQSWDHAVTQLFEFRQKGGIGRRKGVSERQPGRSHWPEADQLRYLTEKDGDGKHPPEHEKNNVFPRAAFGMPIQFEFKGTKNEPPAHDLLPLLDENKTGERMASPLILRPYWNGDDWQAMALLLPHWQDALEQDLALKPTGQPQHWPKDKEAQKSLAQKIAPMKQYGTDPLSAFMAFFAKKRT